MALLFVDSFDHYATADILQKWTTKDDTIEIGAYGRNSTNGLRCSGGNADEVNVVYTRTANTNTCIVGFAFKWVTHTGAALSILDIRDSATTHVALLLDNTGILTVYRGLGTTLLGTTSATLASGTYYYIELKVAIHDTTGTVDVQVNGSNVLSLTGQDTRNGAAAQWTSICLGNAINNTSNKTFDYDDFYLADSSGATNNDLLGPIRVKAILPDGAGASTDFTPSAGSNFQNVDEASTDGDTTYNSESTAGDHDTYTYAALGLSGTVKGVQTNLMVRSDGAGSETIAPMVRISSTDYQGTTANVTTSYADSRQVYETSPATAAAWTVAEIDGAEFGIKLVS